MDVHISDSMALGSRGLRVPEQKFGSKIPGYLISEFQKYQVLEVFVLSGS